MSSVAILCSWSAQQIHYAAIYSLLQLKYRSFEFNDHKPSAFQIGLFAYKFLCMQRSLLPWLMTSPTLYKARPTLLFSFIPSYFLKVNFSVSSLCVSCCQIVELCRGIQLLFSNKKENKTHDVFHVKKLLRESINKKVCKDECMEPCIE